jgi:hypothetical protein
MKRKAKNALSGLMAGGSGSQPKPHTAGVWPGERLRKKLSNHNVLRNSIGSALVLAAWDQVAQGQTTINYTGSTVLWTVPETGTYDITAFGAQGGTSGLGASGGKGAEIGGDFSLTAGEQLSIAVGGVGGSGGGGDGGGGGGGSFVTSSGLKLVIAGGGGGGANRAGGFGPGLIGLNGGYSYNGGTGGFGGGRGGGYNGGSGGGGGGGGFLGDGVSGSGGYNGGGGKGFPNSLAGGTGYSGGGGGGGAGFGGGGGGGYSGGGGGGFFPHAGGPYSGGGGGSFIAVDPQVEEPGFQSGNGEVEITQVPEPSSLALTGLGGFTALAAVARRRRK